jgi:hypothetical protein
MTLRLRRRRVLRAPAAAAACIMSAIMAFAPEVLAAEPKSYLTRVQSLKLHDEIARIPPATRAEFERRYAAWRKTWSRPELAVRSDTRALRDSPEFAALVALGPSVLPLLIEKIAHPEAFFALQAYEGLAPDWPQTLADAGGRIFESEQAKARRAVTDWLAR